MIAGAIAKASRRGPGCLEVALERGADEMQIVIPGHPERGVPERGETLGT